jgi:hypothetical protein
MTDMDTKIRWLLANSELTTRAAGLFVSECFMLGVEAAEWREKRENKRRKAEMAAAEEAELVAAEIEELRLAYQRVIGEEVAATPEAELERLRADPNSWLNNSGIKSTWPSDEPTKWRDPTPILRIVTKDEGGHTDD